MRAVQITEFGGPDVLKLVELPDPEPRPGYTLLETDRIGVNFADTHAIRDDYLAKQELPLIPGVEVCGRDAEGRRFAAVIDNGAYAEKVLVPDRALVPVPDAVDDDQAASLLLQGVTAISLLRVSARLQAGESVAIQAAAGGTGSLAVQLARQLGAGRLIAMASTAEKRQLSLDLGADVAVDSRSEDLAAALIEANQGNPVDVILQMSGGEAFDQCLRALAPFGRLVSFGIASGQENQVSTGHLMRHSRAVIGFWLAHLFGRPDLLKEGVGDVLGAAAEGRLKAVIGDLRPLSEVAAVHQDLVARLTTGKILLDPRK